MSLFLSKNWKTQKMTVAHLFPDQTARKIFELSIEQLIHTQLVTDAFETHRKGNMFNVPLLSGIDTYMIVLRTQVMQFHIVSVYCQLQTPKGNIGNIPRRYADKFGQKDKTTLFLYAIDSMQSPDGKSVDCLHESIPIKIHVLH